VFNYAFIIGLTIRKFTWNSLDIFFRVFYSFLLFIFMSVEFGGRLTQHIVTSFIDKVISQPSAVFVCARVWVWAVVCWMFPFTLRSTFRFQSVPFYSLHCRSIFLRLPLWFGPQRVSFIAGLGKMCQGSASIYRR